MRIQIGFLLPLAALCIGAGDSQKSTQHVEIDGARYRVTVKAGIATVARKSLIVTYSIEERDRQRAAVLKATGCRLVDEMEPGGGITQGKLDCPK